MATGTDAWTGLRSQPVRFLTSSWPWRSLAYLASGAAVGSLALVAFFALVGIGVITSVVVVGFFVLGAVPLLGVAVAGLERRRLAWLGVEVPVLPRATAPGASLRERVRAVRHEPTSGRELGYAVLLAVVLWLVDAVVAFNAVFVPGVLLVSPVLAGFDRVDILFWQFDRPIEAVPLAVVGAPALYVVAAYLVTVVAAAQGSLARILLSPSEAVLEARVQELGRSRVRLVDAFETERRRIERDLHDGVQQRLVALTMTLGSAELEADGAALALVQRAHREAEEALADLRATVRGIHPRVLVDHGLVAAVHEVADRSPVPVHVDVELPGRLDGAVEAAAYFVVSEALTNVARHAQASEGRVTGRVLDGRLLLTVTDNGAGGADVAAGSGLFGLVTRLEALDGTLTVTSPSGGPTEVRMECPCRITV